MLVSINRAPNRTGPGQNTQIGGAPKLGMAFKSPSRGRANPGTPNDLITQEGCSLVIDLVAHYNPQQLSLIYLWSFGAPVGYGQILHPTQVDHIVDVPQLIDVTRLNGYAHFKMFNFWVQFDSPLDT
jgi:hypothetical protein